MECRIPVFSISQLLKLCVQDTVALNVCFVHHIETILFAKFIPFRVIRIVGCTNSIDIELLHHLYVLHHLVDRESSAVYSIVLLTVDTLDSDSHTIHEELPVFHFNGTEAKWLSHTFLHFTILVSRSDNEGIKVRVFCIPRLNILELLCEMEQSVSRRSDVLALAEELLASSREHLDFYLLSLYRIEHTYIEREVAILIIIDEAIAKYIVVHAALRACLDEYVALNTAIFPVVLVFQIATIAKAEHLHSQTILTFLQELGNIEVCRQAAVFAIAYKLTVNPKVESRFHTFEIHDDIHSLPVFWHGEFMHIMAYRVVILWYVWRVCLERICYVGIDWSIEALKFPASWHVDVLPIIYII